MPWEFSPPSQRSPNCFAADPSNSFEVEATASLRCSQPPDEKCFQCPSCLLCYTSDLPLVVAPSRARRGEVARPCPLHNSSGHVFIVRISLLGEGLLKGMHSMAHCSKQSIKRMAPVNLSVGRESSSSARVASGSCESGPGSTRCNAVSSVRPSISFV